MARPAWLLLSYIGYFLSTSEGFFAQRHYQMDRYGVNCESVENCSISWTTTERAKKVNYLCRAQDSSNKKKVCQNGFTKGKNLDSCYHFNPTMVTWFQAIKQCELLGTDLVSIESTNEHMFLSVQLFSLPEFNGISAHTSGNDLISENDFYWLSTFERFNVAHWAVDQPNNYNNSQHCVILDNGDRYLLNDQTCLFRAGYVCEHPPY